MADRTKLPSIDILNFEGLATKQSPETIKPTQLRECKNADFFREYGSMSKMRGNLPVLGSIYSEIDPNTGGGVTKGVYWGANYKAQDLSGAIDRHVLIGAGTTLQELNSNGSITELLDGEPDELYRSSCKLDRFLFITSQDPFDVGKRGQMSKYDGTRITQWGLTEPGGQVIKYTDGGSTETVGEAIEEFDDADLFTEGNSTATNSTLPAWNGTSVKMVGGAASTSSYIERLNVTPFAINTIIEDRAKMQVYIPREEYRKLAISGRAISVYVGSSATLGGNYYRYDFQIGRLFEGWNTLVFDFSTFPSGDFGTTVGIPDDEFLASYRFEIITNDASDEATVYFDQFVSLDEGAPTPTFADPDPATGGIFNQSSSAVWNYRVTFVDDAGFESNAGPESIEADNTTGDVDYGQIDLTIVPISENDAVVRRNLYRTVASGSEFLFLDTLNDNVTATYTDSTSDISLGSSTPPVFGGLIFDNSRPPSGAMSMMWKRTAFVAGDPLNPTVLAYSRFDLPEAFPILNAIEFDERVTGLFATSIGLVVTTESSWHRVLGDNPDYIVDVVKEGFGGVGFRGTGTSREIGWAVDRDGLRLYDLREALKVSEVIRDRVDAFDKSALEDTHTVHSRRDNMLLWFTKDADGVYSSIYNYTYLVDEVRQGWFNQIEANPATFDIQAMWEVEDDNGDHKLYGCTSGGMVHSFMEPDAANWTDDDGKQRAITFEMQTARLRLGDMPVAVELTGESGRVSPRLIELRAKERTGKAHSWTVTLSTCDSSADAATPRDTQEMTFNFDAGKSLMRLPPQDLTPGEFLQVKVTNSQKNVDVAITGIRIFFMVRPGQFVVTGSQLGSGGQN